MTMRQNFTIAAIICVVALLLLSLISSYWLLGFLVVGPVIALGIYDMFQTKHSIRRLYPVLGHFRYLLEAN